MSNPPLASTSGCASNIPLESAGDSQHRRCACLFFCSDLFNARLCRINFTVRLSPSVRTTFRAPQSSLATIPQTPVPDPNSRTFEFFIVMVPPLECGTPPLSGATKYSASTSEHAQSFAPTPPNSGEDWPEPLVQNDRDVPSSSSSVEYLNAAGTTCSMAGSGR